MPISPRLNDKDARQMRAEQRPAYLLARQEDSLILVLKNDTWALPRLEQGKWREGERLDITFGRVFPKAKLDYQCQFHVNEALVVFCTFMGDCSPGKTYLLDLLRSFNLEWTTRAILDDERGKHLLKAA